MLENLSQRLTHFSKKMRGQTRLTEANTKEALREVRMALLEADVALPVVKTFIDAVRLEAQGKEVLDALTPGQAFIGVVHKQLIAIMGGETAPLNLATKPPAVFLMVGLQGAGKTTSVGKLGKYLSETLRKKVLVVSCDVYRPAAIEQLRLVAAQAKVDYLPSTTDDKPIDICLNAIDYAKKHYHDVLLIDTAGRTTIDDAMMTEIKALHKVSAPAETLFVVDAMLGQDAVQTAQTFHNALNVSGIILTKLDGDSRGGAALSVRHITGAPIKFVGISEHLDGLDVFHPDRLAGRILGMGDVLSLIEEVEQKADVEQSRALVAKLQKGKGFSLADFKAQLMQMNAMGGINKLAEKLPGQLSQFSNQLTGSQSDQMTKKMIAIIDSMTPLERNEPALVKASRKRRIAKGAGVAVSDINRLLNQFNEMNKMMRKFKQGGMNKLLRSLGGRFPGGGL